MDNKSEEIELRKQKIMDATRLLGRNQTYIKNALKEYMISAWNKTMMVRPMQSLKDKKGRTIATTRMIHYADTAIIARKIAEGLFPNDKEFAQGVAIAAMYHDFGQPAFGHEGGAARDSASAEYNGDSREHGTDGMFDILFRQYNIIEEAINSGRIISNEASKRGITEKELRDKIKMGMELDVSEMIEEETKKNQELTQIAIRIIALAAGNHNGERGTANIVPKYERTYEEAYNIALETYIDGNKDKEMAPCNIVDAIVKISDQISSITNDIFDGVKSGIEDDIYEGWAEPIAKILHITEEDALDKLKGNYKELSVLRKQLRNEFINSVIRSSNQEELNMDLAPLLYGETDERGQIITNGLRTFNMTEHTTYTSTAESEVTLYNITSKMTEKLATSILDENKIFPPKLNELFRLSSKHPTRRVLEKRLLNSYENADEYRKFYEYAVELSKEEYDANKEIVKRREAQFYREIIENVLNRRKDIVDHIEPRSPKNTLKYFIEEYVLSPNYEPMNLDGNEEYSDKEINSMMDRVNAFLAANSNENIGRLPLIVTKHKYQLGAIGEVEKISTGTVKMNTDEQIAARIALNYMARLNDEEFINLARKMDLLTDEEMQYFLREYSKHSAKRHGKEGYKGESYKKTQGKYEEANMSSKGIKKNDTGETQADEGTR